MLQRRLPRGTELHVVGQQDRELLVGDGDDAVGGAVHDGDGAAPVALARQEPVPEAVVDRALADPPLLQPLDGPFLGGGDVGDPVEPLAVDLGAVAQVGLALPALGRLDRTHDGQPVGDGEVPVPLVLRGHGHDRPRPVAHEHVLGQVDGDGLAVEGVGHGAAGEDAPLLQRPLRGLALDLRLPAYPLYELRHLPAVLFGRQSPHHGMLGRHDRIGHAEGGVGAGGEHAQGGAVRDRTTVRFDQGQVELRTLRSADPVSLHDLDPLGPVQAVQVPEQLFRVGGDPEEPLLQVALGYHVARTLAGPVRQDLLVGQHRLAAGTPVHRRHGPVGQPRVQEALEDELVPAHVLRVVAAYLPAPVVDGADGDDAGLQLLDARLGEDPGVDPRLDGRVLGGQAEGVEAEGGQHGVALHPAVAHDQVAEGVVAHVAHVRPPARVGVHRQHVVLGLRIPRIDLVGPLRGPPLLPLPLDGLRVVALGHCPKCYGRPLPRTSWIVTASEYSKEHVFPIEPAVRPDRGGGGH